MSCGRWHYGYRLHDQELLVPGLPQPREYVFDLIQHYSQKFAYDIHEHTKIAPESIDLFHSSLYSIKLLLGITPQDIENASQQQLYRNSGFWEMRRFIGQFGDVAEAAVQDGVTDIVSAATSGCIIGEYLGLLMSEQVHHPVPGPSHGVLAVGRRSPSRACCPNGSAFRGSMC